MDHGAGAQNGISRAERRERLFKRASVHVVARGEAWFVGGPCTPDRCNPLGTRCSSPTLFPRPSATLLCCRSAVPSRVYSAHSAARARFLPPSARSSACTCTAMCLRCKARSVMRIRGRDSSLAVAWASRLRERWVRFGIRKFGNRGLWTIKLDCGGALRYLSLCSHF